MFENIGGKIKGLAQIVCWVGIIGSVLCGLFIIALGPSELSGVGLLIMIFGSLGAWAGSFMTYGFGQLIENSDILAGKLRAEASAATKEDRTKSQLNDWREQGLITEEEYNVKMEELR